MVPLVNIMLSEVIFGGVGAGMYGMLIYIVLAVFIAGLMVGRTPEYLGKKIEAYDVKMAMLVVLVFPLVILGFSAISVVARFGTFSILNPGPHGLSEIIYAFTSQAGNNGSAFAGLTTNTLWYNTAGAITMLVGRFLMIIPALAIAGNLAGKKYVPPSLGTFPVTTPLFTVLLIGVEIGSVITTVLLFKGGAAFKFNLQITLWLWFTVLFANFAEAMAEGRGKAQADTLRKARSETVANRLIGNDGQVEMIASSKLRAGDLVYCSASELIPSHAEII